MWIIYVSSLNLSPPGPKPLSLLFNDVPIPRAGVYACWGSDCRFSAKFLVRPNSLVVNFYCFFYWMQTTTNYVQCPRNYCDGVTLNQCLINNNNNNNNNNWRIPYLVQRIWTAWDKSRAVPASVMEWAGGRPLNYDDSLRQFLRA